MRPSETKYDPLRIELYLNDSVKLDGGTGIGGGDGTQEIIAEIIEAARTTEGPLALYELSSRGPTLRELFGAIFDGLNPKLPSYPTH